MTPLLSLDDAAAHLGVTRDWLLRQATAQAVPSVRMGRRHCFTTEQLEQIVTARTRQAIPTRPRLRSTA